MREPDIQRMKAVLLYILNKMPDGTRDVYHIVKTAFYAQKNHFVKYALPLFNDRISALPFGPVPSLMYNILRVARGESQPYRFCDDRVLSRIAAAIDYQDESFTSNEQPDMECLSKSNIECLDEAIGEVSRMRFDKLMAKTHGAEWTRAFHNPTSHKMDDLSIARESGASEEVLAYLADSLEIDKALD